MIVGIGVAQVGGFNIFTLGEQTFAAFLDAACVDFVELRALAKVMNMQARKVFALARSGFVAVLIGEDAQVVLVVWLVALKLRVEIIATKIILQGLALMRTPIAKSVI